MMMAALIAFAHSIQEVGLKSASFFSEILNCVDSDLLILYLKYRVMATHAGYNGERNDTGQR